jgi:endonuclease-3
MASLDDLGEIAARLEVIFGRPAWAPDLDPLSELISSVIGQQTAGPAARRAFEQLRRAFPTWEEARQAPVEAVAAVIASAGLGRLKAQRIKGLLEAIACERGELRLDFLAALPVEEAVAWLQRLPGVGPTTAACAILFGLNRPAFPVDTGIRRTALRLGLASPGTPAGRLQAMLAGAVPPEDVYATHVNLIRFSRQFCTSSDPACPICPLNDLCASFGRYHPQITRRYQAQALSRTTSHPLDTTIRSASTAAQPSRQLLR